MSLSQRRISSHGASCLKRLEETFIATDKDNDDLLNKEEFIKFVEIGYNKKCPPGMYESVCKRFKSDPILGINWNTAKTIYIQANQTRTINSANSAKKTPKINNETSNSSNSSESPTTIRQNSMSISSDIDRSGQYKRRISTRSLSNDTTFTNDTSSMIVDILDNKNKSLQNKYLKEHTKRKKTEEIAQSLLNENDAYKLQIESLNETNTKLNAKNKALNEEVIKLRSIVGDDRNSIKHLRQQRTAIKTELDEAKSVCTKMKQEHNLNIAEITTKHKCEMERLCNGLLESLGAETGTTDISAVIKTLKMNNMQLHQTVDTLSVSLARKQQSLVEALQAVDDMAMGRKHEEKQQEQQESVEMRGGKRIRYKLKEWNQRRKSRSFALQRKFSVSVNSLNRNISHSVADSDFVGVSHVNDNEIPLQLNASFWKNVNENHCHNVNDKSHSDNNNNKLSVDNVNNVKEMQFLSQQLTNNVSKTQSIQNLEVANTVLLEQMEKMKNVMEQMKDEKNKYDNLHKKNTKPYKKYQFRTQK